MRTTLLLLLALTGCPSANTDESTDTDADGSQTDTDVPDTDVADTDLPDQDADGLSDEVEGGTTGRDTDGDGTPDMLDTDSDDDCIPDAMEAPFRGADVNDCLSWGGQPSTVFHDRRARMIGLVGSGAPAEVRSDLEAMASDSGATNPTNHGAPLVFDAGVDASAALANAIRTLASTAETDLTLVLEDDATDALDVRVWIDHLETAQRGTTDCMSGLTDRDADADTYADPYVHVPAQAGVCWTLVPATNSVVPATGSIQTYRGTARLVADGSITVETRELVFVVPAELTF